MTSEGEPHSDGVAWDWKAQAEGSEFYSSLERAVRRHVAPGARVLEIGVGSGYLMSRLNLAQNCSCYGVDLLDSAICASSATARAMGARLALARGSGFSLPFRDRSFDVVSSFGVIEHFDPERARDMVREHARVCRTGGLVIVSTPNALDFCHSLRRGLLGDRYPYHPERSYTPWELASELRRCGLEPVSADGYAPLWGLRQIPSAYLLTALLHKSGALERLHYCSRGGLLSWLGNMTLQVARRPPGQREARE